jgi:hypothetical protein
MSTVPGTNEVPEDALVLQLRLSKGQEALIEALRGQQAEVKELQRLLTGQQGALVSQQRDILEQQRRMYEQMDHVRNISSSQSRHGIITIMRVNDADKVMGVGEERTSGLKLCSIKEGRLWGIVETVGLQNPRK